MPLSQIVEYISQSERDISEYQLIKYIEAKMPHFFEPIGADLTLFRKHFYLFHVLYTANRDQLEANQFFSISPLKISIEYRKQDKQEVSKTHTLESFYCDKKNLELSEDEVNKMLLGFWEKFIAIGQKTEAIIVLELQEEKKLTSQILKKRFNKLAQKNHPDKGGNSEEFDKIKQAYEILKKVIV